jgi:hypothetical protein
MWIFQNRALRKILGARGTRYQGRREDFIIRSVMRWAGKVS